MMSDLIFAAMWHFRGDPNYPLSRLNLIVNDVTQLHQVTRAAVATILFMEIPLSAERTGTGVHYA